MSNDNILLTIAIPTYNRPKEFERMLSVLMPQLVPGIELMVKDDSPNDETKDIFNGLVKKFNPPVKLTYLKGKKEGGVDAVYLFFIENATGKYVWWFGDDDEFFPGSVENVLATLKKYPEISFIWANYVSGDNIVIKNREDGFFKDGNEILEEIGPALGYLSPLIFEREKALPSLPLARKYVVGFSFANLVAILHVIAGTGKFYFLKGPIFKNNPTTPEEIKKTVVKDGVIKNEGFNVYGVDYYNIVREFSGKFKSGSIRKILKDNFACLWRGMLVAWIGGWDTPKGKLWKMFKLYWSFPEFWIALPLFLMPVFVNRGLYKIYKIFFSHRKFVFGRN